MYFCVIRLQFWYLSTKLLCVLMLWCLKHCAAAQHVWSDAGVSQDVKSEHVSSSAVRAGVLAAALR